MKRWAARKIDQIFRTVKILLEYRSVGDGFDDINYLWSGRENPFGKCVESVPDFWFAGAGSLTATREMSQLGA